MGSIRFLLAVILALRAWFIRWTNEIVVTDRRRTNPAGDVAPIATQLYELGVPFLFQELEVHRLFCLLL
jgi:hypothetical protein